MSSFLFGPLLDSAGELVPIAFDLQQVIVGHPCLISPLSWVHCLCLDLFVHGSPYSAKGRNALVVRRLNRCNNRADLKTHKETRKSIYGLRGTFAPPRRFRTPDGDGLFPAFYLLARATGLKCALFHFMDGVRPSAKPWAHISWWVIY